MIVDVIAVQRGLSVIHWMDSVDVPHPGLNDGIYGSRTRASLSAFLRSGMATGTTTVSERRDADGKVRMLDFGGSGGANTAALLRRAAGTFSTRHMRAKPPSAGPTGPSDAPYPAPQGSMDDALSRGGVYNEDDDPPRVTIGPHLDSPSVQQEDAQRRAAAEMMAAGYAPDDGSSLMSKLLWGGLIAAALGGIGYLFLRKGRKGLGRSRRRRSRRSRRRAWA